MALSPYDQQVYDAGFEFIPQTKFLQNPFQIPQSGIATDPNTGAGITTIPLNRGGDDDVQGYESFTPSFTRRGVFADPKEYGPGGMYEVNPTALGFEFGPQGQVMRAGPGKNLQGQLGPTTTNPRIYGSSLDRGMFRVAGIPAREIAEMYDARMQNVPGQDVRNFFRNLMGAKSNFAAARAPGSLQQMMEKIPSLTGILSALGGNVDRSDRSRFAVDNAGFGQGTGRDQFGVFTGGKTLFGKTSNYTERMKNEISDIAKNFGYSEEDLLGLDPATLNALGARNKFRQTQVIDYVNKLRAKDIEAKYKAALDKQRREEIMKTQSYRNITSGDMGDDGQTPGGGGGNVATSGGDVYGGEAFGYNEAAEKSDFYADGGIVDMLEIYD